jgi:2-polyprenyl-6-methoxyphenol hydroxylase-like FAD-dependent oxidoreductase
MSNIPANTDVLIIGAGPTGLALATSLAKAGVDHVLIDKLAAGQNTSRAAVIHAHTLEALETLGVADRLAKTGLKLSRFSIRDRDRVLVQLCFDALPSPFSYLLMTPQDQTERVLAERHEELGGSIHRGIAAENIEQYKDHVRVWVREGDIRRSIDARLVVGADGMHSIVREAARIEFDGAQYAHSFVLADVSMDWAPGRGEVFLFFTEHGPLVVAPLPNGNFRIVAAMENAPEHPNAACIQDIIDAYGPTNAKAVVRRVDWSSRFRIHHRLAKTYRRGRLIIMGDAAHVHSPAGGQGMNTGIVDAIVLGRALTGIISNKRSEKLLDVYERLRRPAARKVLDLADGLTRMAMTKGAIARRARNARLSVLNHLPPAKRLLVMNLSGLSRRAQARLAS